jgi:hypothetical protein
MHKIKLGELLVKVEDAFYGFDQSNRGMISVLLSPRAVVADGFCPVGSCDAVPYLSNPDGRS